MNQPLHRRRIIQLQALGIGAALLAATIATPVSASEPSSQPATSAAAEELKALRAEVSQLRAEVKDLKQTGRQETAGPEQARQTADALARDARRSDLSLDVSGISPVTAGWENDRGFFIASEDREFLLSPFILLQARYATSWRQDAKVGGSDDTQTGFEIRRLQLGFDGNVFSPDFTYRIFWQASDLTSGNLELLMAWFQYRIHGTPWVIGGGQFKDPLDHEQLIGDAAQLAADRTYVDDVLAGGEAFSKGVTVRYDDGGPLRGEAAFTSGFNNNNTTFQDFPTNSESFGVAGRVDYKLMGHWKDYEHFTSQGNTGDLLVVGGGADLTEAGHTNALRHVIDAQYNPGALGFYAAYLGRYTSGNTAGVEGNTYDSSLRFQASCLVTARWEAFARYDYLHLDGHEFKEKTASSVQEITVGSTYYFHGQRLKLTFDLAYLPNGAPVLDQGNDVLANNGHGELIFRGQFQLLL
jgi:cell division protein FtsB